MWSGVGFGGLIVPAFGWSIDEYGWRNASIIVGILVTIIGMPIAALMRHKPEPYGMLPDGEIPQNGTEFNSNNALKEDSSNDFTVKEALCTSSFWFLNISIMSRSFVTGGVGLHLVPYCGFRSYCSSSCYLCWVCWCYKYSR